MSFQSNLRKSVAKIRAIPKKFGVRVYSVAVRVQTWTGAERGEGAAATTTYKIAEFGGAPPKVRWLNQEQLALAGLEFGAEVIEVGPVTPGNTPREYLTPPTSGNNSVVEWIVTGPKYPNGACFSLRELRDDRGYQFKAVLKKSAD